MKDKDLVLLVSNDALPKMGLVSLAPGLRYHYLYQGLKELGVNVKVAMPVNTLEKKWKDKHNNEFFNLQKNDDYLFFRNDLQKIIKKSKAKYVIFCNAMQADKISQIKNVKFIYDMFAPKLFEMICESNHGFESIDMKSYIKRKKMAFDMADGFIVNGKKKIPYIYGFGLASGNDLTSLPIEIIHMAVETEFRSDNQCHKNIAIAGAQQRWTQHGPWLRELYEFLVENIDTSLHLLIPKKNQLEPRKSKIEADDIFEKILLLPNTKSHDEKTYAEYVDFLHKMDLVIDLFERNVEREHAVVSRTVNAICCGIPVIHSSFTEISDLIIQYDAGWIVDEKGTELKSILNNYSKNYQEKIDGAKKLALTEFNYQVNAKKIVNLLKSYD